MTRIQSALTAISLVFNPKNFRIGNPCNAGRTHHCSFITTTRRNVHLHGRVSLQTLHSKRKKIQQHEKESNNNLVGDGTSFKIKPSSGNTHSFGARPLDPETLCSDEYLEECVDKLATWFQGKKNVLCITGAGISTDSGIPDYRGFNGSYHRGHKPMVHDQFMSSKSMRQRYWGRSMVGWKEFANASPNDAHYSLAKLEEMGFIGVKFEDKPIYHKLNDDDDDDVMMRWAFSDGSQKLSIITQNVDGLHRRAGTRHLTELHGRNDRLKCMDCGSYHCRHQFHDSLMAINSDWLKETNNYNNRILQTKNNDGKKNELRPDGDAFIAREVYDVINIPSCLDCGKGFYKPDVVFFGDSVPKHRVERCYAAVDECDGLFCVGSSLAVHSAYRFVQHGAKSGTPIAILNVGETRAEVNGLKLLKVDAPASQTLSALVNKLSK